MERTGERLDPEKTAAAMAPYVAAGLTSFDMADHYGSAEVISGSYKASYPETGVELLTKWVPEPRSTGPEEARAAVERALERTQSEKLDLLQFHTWAYDDPLWLERLLRLQELKDEGLIGHLGLTNVDAAHLNVALASGIDIVSNQVSYSLIDQRARGELTGVCLARGVKILAYGTLAGGLLTGSWVGKPDPTLEGLTTWSQAKYYRFIQEAGGWDALQNLLEVLFDVASAYEVSVANVASRFILQQPAVGGVIIGARLGAQAHLEETLKLFAFELDGPSLYAINEARAALKPIPGDCGDEYRKPPFLTASGDLSHHVADFPAPYEVLAYPDGSSRALSGTTWETLAGYCRASRKGGRIYVSGTTATHGDRLLGGDDAAAQTHAVIDKIEGALRSLGAGLEHVVRTRIFVRHIADWEAVAKAHGARFKDILPANTLVQAALVGEDYLVEIEAEAEVGD